MYKRLILITVVLAVVVAAGTAKAELLAHWRFDTDTKDTVGGYDCNLAGAAALTTVSPIKGTGCLKLDTPANYYGTQVHDYAYVSGAKALALGSKITSQFTVTMWVQADSDATQSGGYGKVLFSAQNHLGIITMDVDLISAQWPYWTGSSSLILYDCVGLPNINSNKTGTAWKGVVNHFAIVKDSQRLRFYKDGVEWATSSMNTLAITGIKSIVIGGGWNGGYDGRIDDVAIWNTGLSAAEISSVYASGVPLSLNSKNPGPAVGAVVPVVGTTLSWFPGETSTSHQLYIGTVFNDVNDATTSTPVIYKGAQTSPYNPSPALVGGTTYYWRVDEVGGSNPSGGTKGTVWSFSTIPTKAYGPGPANAATRISTQPKLSWLPGNGAVSRKVYFGTNPASLALIGNDITDTNIAVGPLENVKVYYWRVDEKNSLGAVTTGDVWSFTTITYQIAASDITASSKNSTPPYIAQKTCDESGLDSTYLLHDIAQANMLSGGTGGGDIPGIVGSGLGTKWWIKYDFSKMYTLRTLKIWNYNVPTFTYMGLRNVTIYYSSVAEPNQESHWQTLGDVNVPQGTGLVNLPVSITVNFGDVSAKHVAIVAKPWVGFGEPGGGSWGPLNLGQNGNGVSEVRFGVPGVMAEGETPDNGAVEVPKNQVLSWLPGAFAASHKVFFGTSFADVNTAVTAVTTLPRNTKTYTPALTMNKTYYWRVDEVNGVNTWKGDVWSFTTNNSLTVEDFERYTDDVNLLSAWPDGIYDGMSDSMNYLMLDANYVHGNHKALRMNFSDHDWWPYYSKTTRTYSANQNWTADGVVALQLYWRGNSATAVNTAGRKLYIMLTDGATTPHSAKIYYPSANFASDAWTAWDIKLSDFTGVDLTKVKKIELGEEGDVSHPQPPAALSGDLYFDDIRLFTARCRPEMVAADIDNDCYTDQMELREMATYWMVGDYTIPATAPSDANLVAKYIVGQSSGTTLTDAGTHGYNGEFVGTPTWVTDSTKGSCLELGGELDHDCVNLPGAIMNDNITTQFTLSLWQYGQTDTSPQYNVIFAADYILDVNTMDRASTTVVALPWYVSPQVFVFFDTAWDGGTSDRLQSGMLPSSLWKNVWSHWAFTKNAATGMKTIYCNGAVLFSAGGSTATNTQHVTACALGATRENTWTNGYRYWWKGRLADVRIYNKALSENEVIYLACGSGGKYYPIPSKMELSSTEAVNSKLVNFKDFAILAKSWLKTQLWP